MVVTIFHLIMNQMEFHMVHIQKENCHYGHIPFHSKGISKKRSFPSVAGVLVLRTQIESLALEQRATRTPA